MITIKKVISVLLFITIVSSLSVISIYAKEQPLKNRSIDLELGEALIKSFSFEERQSLQNKESYLDDAKHLEISDQPIVKVYTFPSELVSSGFLPFNELINACDEMIKNDYVNGCGYVVFDDEPIAIYRGYVGGIYNRDIVQLYKPIYLPSQNLVHNYVIDIQNMKANVEILKENCNVYNIVVFDGYTNFDCSLLYADTDKGVFVKHYSNPTDEGIWLREDDFLKLVKAYADQNDWTKSDHTHSGSYLSTFIETYADRIDELPLFLSDVPKKVPVYVGIIAVSGVIILCTVVALFIFRKKIFISKYRH